MIIISLDSLLHIEQRKELNLKWGRRNWLEEVESSSSSKIFTKQKNHFQGVQDFLHKVWLSVLQEITSDANDDSDCNDTKNDDEFVGAFGLEQKKDDF